MSTVDYRQLTHTFRGPQIAQLPVPLFEINGKIRYGTVFNESQVTVGVS